MDDYRELPLPVGITQVKPASSLAFTEGPAVDSRGCITGTCRRVRAAAGHPRISKRQQAEEHVYRQAAGTNIARYRTCTYVLSSGRRRDRQALVQRPEPAEHPNPDAGGPSHPAGVCCTAQIILARRRLLADRAANHGAPVRRQRAAKCVRGGTRYSSGHSGRGIRDRPGRCHCGPAPFGNSD